MTRDEFMTLGQELDLPEHIVEVLWVCEFKQTKLADDGLIALAMMVVAAAYHNDMLAEVATSLRQLSAAQAALNN